MVKSMLFRVFVKGMRISISLWGNIDKINVFGCLLRGCASPCLYGGMMVKSMLSRVFVKGMCIFMSLWRNTDTISDVSGIC